jgi:hypothetical protein
MRKLIVAALAASTLVAAPAAAAEFTGPRLGLTVGTGGDDIVDFDGQTVGVELGYDADLGNMVAGVGVEYQTDLGDDFLELNESAIVGRLGAKVGTGALVYGSAGYTRIGASGTPFGGTGADGYRLGLGAEFGAFKVEQRYYDYGNNVDAWQTVAGLNFRF